MVVLASVKRQQDFPEREQLNYSSEMFEVTRTFIKSSQLWTYSTRAVKRSTQPPTDASKTELIVSNRKLWVGGWLMGYVLTVTD